ncbi:pimeloyl-ACP methyl ester carboxylesterase [Nocardia tenerifensis]|uniref:Pimeloyl-ACP methyl ester carboxylesterase n=1 Tax=Nocardia tenerifensis TaxID=228006 RepID=A0A318JS78_9NOCA|nr:alpha/beta hydrolase [Nocardia tenerifensis]PXX58832.1 pimeloyl-ACP methyl ester carboxylesterase [Nocardia tenerifensis]
MANDVQLGEVRTWYDETGDGEPILLLHGGFVDSRSFEPAVAGLAEHFRVFRMDRRGHGRTPDVAGPLTYDLMAQDTIAFLDTVVGGAAHLVGYSDGAVVALLVAVRRPDLVRKLVAISGNFHRDGVLPGVLDGFADEEPMRRLAARYGEVSPDGEEHFPVVADKVLRMGREGPTLTVEELAAITSPTLVVAADDDAVSLEHTIALYRAIPNSELAIVPGTSHLLIVEKPAEVYRLIGIFLTTEPPRTLQPIRRA